MARNRLHTRLAAALLAVCLLCAGCDKADVPAVTNAPAQTTVQTSTVPETVPAEPAPVATESAAPEADGIPVRCRTGMDYGPEHDGETISMVRLADMPYVRPDVEQLIEDYDALIEQSKTSSNADALLAAYFDLEYRVMQYYTSYNLAWFRSDLNTTDSYYEAEYAYCSAQDPILWDKEVSLMRALAVSPCRGELERRYDGFNFDYYEKYDSEADAGYLSFLQQEDELLEQYHALTGAPAVSYAGETKLLNEWMQSDSAKLRDGAYSAYIEQYHDEIGTLFLELVRVRQQLAAALGYESYMDYVYDNYGRDYTPEDAEAFLADVRQYLVPVADALYARDPELRLGYTDALDEDPVALLATAAKNMGGPIWEAFRFLDAYELYDLSPTPEKRDRSYIIYLPAYESPIIFINPLKHPDVYDSLSHEFGHFVDCYVQKGQLDDVETSETFSQAMVYLALANAELPADVKAEALRMSLTELLLERIIERSTYADFERQVYAIDPAELSLERLDAIYEQCCLDDGHRVPYPDEIRPKSWVRDLYFFDNAGYVISYPLSAVASLQICKKEAEQPGAGVAAFCRLLNFANGWYPFQDVLPCAGLQSPFRQNYNNQSPLVDIAAFLRQALDLT